MYTHIPGIDNSTPHTGAGTASTSTAPTTSRTSRSATTDAPPHTLSASHRYSSRQSGIQVSSRSPSGPRTAASRSCGPRATRRGTGTTPTTCLGGRATRCSAPWTRGATSQGARSSRRRALRRGTRVPRSLLSLRPSMVVSSHCAIRWGRLKLLTLLIQGWKLCPET